jgi:histone H3/H4
MLSQNMEKFTNDSDDTNDISIKNIQRVLLEAMAEKIWDMFHSKIPTHVLERMLKIIAQASSLLAINGSFLHVIESILLQIYSLNRDSSVAI